MNDVNFSECKFSSDIVPYMYGETSGPERSAFESHLLGCAGCTDEFALISNARFEVYDWKKIEFDPLETPYIRIPYDELVSEPGFSGWAKKLRAAFGNPWIIPGAAFASIAIISVSAAVFILSGDGNLDVAATVDSTNIAAIKNPAAPTVEPKAAMTEGAVKVDGRRIEASRPANPIRSRQTAPHSAPNMRATMPRSIEAKVTTRNAKKSVPSLNEFADDEDTSLRLAELFEDIETRD